MPGALIRGNRVTFEKVNVLRDRKFVNLNLWTEVIEALLIFDKDSQ